MINYNFDKANSYIGDRGSMIIDGIGIIKIQPNIAVATLGIITEDISLEKAQKENAVTTNSVINGLIQMAIPKELIKTTSFNIEAQYDYIEGKQVFRDYRVSNILSVTITNISKTGEIIDGATADGANRIDYISFSIENPSMYYKHALNLAIKDAIEKVKEIARTLRINVELIPYKIIEINNTTAIEENPMLKLSLASTPIMPGQINISAKVKAFFISYPIS